MSTAAISNSSPLQGLQSYFQDRKGDLQQLGQALQSGDLAGAQQSFSDIQNLGQNGPFAGGNAFAVNQREQDFNAISQALQSGDIAGAKQAFAQLQSTFTFNHGKVDPPHAGPAIIINISEQAAAASTGSSATTSGTSTTSTTGSTTAASGPEIVINLANNSGSGEEITLSLNNTSNGAEQLTIGVGSQQNPNAQQFTLNLAQNSNEQIVLNLLGNTASSSPFQPNGVNVVA